MKKILKRIRSIELLVKHQPQTLITLLIYPAILLVGSMISIAPRIIGYNSWAQVQAIEFIMSWVTIVISIMFSFTYIKYIQQRLFGRKVSIFDVRSSMQGMERIH